VKILFYGYGNPSRQDDGLGIKFCESLERWKEKIEDELSFETNYQLNAEDSSIIKDFDLIVFVDAIKEQTEPFCLKRILPSDVISFSTHSMTPECVLSLCDELYNKKPIAYILSIKGFEWNFGENLTEEALNNLNMALEFIKDKLRKNNLM